MASGSSAVENFAANDSCLMVSNALAKSSETMALAHCVFIRSEFVYYMTEDGNNSSRGGTFGSESELILVIEGTESAWFVGRYISFHFNLLCPGKRHTN